MTPAQFMKWLEDIRKHRTNISDAQIAREIGRSDQWIINAKKRGTSLFDSLALKYYLLDVSKKIG